MSELRKMIRHTSHYFTGNFLSIISGFISFPILTRIFTVSDYGILNIISSILIFMVAFGKLGIQNSVVRFYNDYQKDTKVMRSFYSTFLIAAFVISGIVTAVYFGVIRILPFTSRNAYLFNLLFMAGLLIFSGAVISIQLDFLRASQESKLYNQVNVARKYLSLGLKIFLVFFIVKGLYGFYAGMLIAEVVILIYLLKKLIKNYGFSCGCFSIKLFKQALAYGSPLVVFEISYIVLGYSDRILISGMLGNFSVGEYSAGYNLSEYIALLFIQPVGLALMPIYMKIYSQRGEEYLKKFLGKIIRYFFLVGIPVAFGLSAIADDLIPMLASSKYAGSSVVVPFVVAGLIFYGSHSIFAAGIHIYRKTIWLSLFIVIASALNVLLNLKLIPLFGISGAALATLISYIVLTLLIMAYSFKYLKFNLSIIKIILYTSVAFIMYEVVVNINFSFQPVNILMKILSGIIVYSAFILCLDRELRDRVMKFTDTFTGGKNAV